MPKPRPVWFAVAMVVAACLAVPAQPAVAAGPGARDSAAKAKKPKIWVRRDYGFLPGYEPPPSNSIPYVPYGDRAGFKGPPYPQYWYRGLWLYGYGPPGFVRGRWNGGGIGPCWTQTPIGLMWNCGR